MYFGSYIDTVCQAFGQLIFMAVLGLVVLAIAAVALFFIVRGILRWSAEREYRRYEKRNHWRL